MNTHRLVTSSRLGLLVLLAGVLIAVGPRAFAQSANSSQLQAAVASKLSRDAVLQGQSIMVNADGSQITLSGTVQTEKQWQEAESVTANVSGVRTIQNNLTIAGQSSASSQMQAPPPPPDAQQPEEPQQPEAPAAPSSYGNNAENPPPPPPDQQSNQSGQNYANGQTQPEYRPQYQSEPQGQAYGAGYGAQNEQNYNPYGNQSGYPSAPPQPMSGPVAVAAGTLLQIRTIEPLDSAHLQAGQTFDATVATDVWEGNVLAIPRGASLQGVVVEAAEPKGKLGGKPHLALRITSLQLGGQFYLLRTNIWASAGPSKAGYTASNTVTGGLLGALIGGIIGRGPGAVAGAGLGAMAGLGASSATKGPRIYIPSEAVLSFRLTEPVTVQPVSWAEARRLSSDVPQLQPRYAPAPRPYPYPYFGPSYYVGAGW